MNQGLQNKYLFSRKLDSENRLYELTMQLAEGDGSISEAIIKGKKLQMKKLIEKNIIDEELAEKKLDLMQEIVTDAENSLMATLIGCHFDSQDQKITIPLSLENKELLNAAYNQISILYSYRNDASPEETRGMLEKFTTEEDTSRTLFTIELHKNLNKIGRIYFIENG